MDNEKWLKPLLVGAGVVLGVAFVTPLVSGIPFMDFVILKDKLVLGQLVVAGASAAFVEYLVNEYM